MVFVPLVLRVFQNLELIRRQDGLDLLEGGLSVWLKTCPDLLQLLAGHLDLCRVLRFARSPIRLLGRVNPGLVGCLILLAGFCEIFLDRLQLDFLLVGELQPLLETRRQQRSFAQIPFILRGCLVLQGLDEGEAIGVGALRQ